MDRREFVATGVTGALGVQALGSTGMKRDRITQQNVRDAFPRLATGETYVNGAAGSPLSDFSEEGIRKYMDFIRLGPADGRRDYVAEVLGGSRSLFGSLIGATADEIGFVESTKAGEQIAIDGIAALRRGGNVVTNDLHFSGSLHNYVGLRASGVDVRIVKADGYDLSLEQLTDAIDDNTALVALSLVSNVNGRVEPMREVADYAHGHGAVVFADIIQAAGVMPLDVKALGIDIASSSSYKWLFGVHGAGFLYVDEAIQDELLRDRIFPGHARRNYSPWVQASDPARAEYIFEARADATRYQPGHVSYIGYAAVYEGMKFIRETGTDVILGHSVRLNRRLLEQLDTHAYEVLSPDIDRSSILTLGARSMEGLRDRLIAANVTISLGGDMWNELRISPSIYNNAGDMDRLAEVLNG